jgi:hypothetical protein
VNQSSFFNADERFSKRVIQHTLTTSGPSTELSTRPRQCQRQLKIDKLSAVASSDHRNGGGLEDLVGSLPSEGLSRPGVELVDHRVDVIIVG